MIDKYLSDFIVINNDSIFNYDTFKKNIRLYDKDINLKFSSGEQVDFELTNYTNYENNGSIKFKLLNSNKMEHIPMIKLFIVLYSIRSNIEYERRDDKYIFNFYLINGSNKRKKIKISVNNKILTKNNNPLFLESNDEIDFVLFKVLIKICNIYNVNIRDIDISKLIEISSNNSIEEIKIKNNNGFFYIDSSLNNNTNLSIKQLRRKIIQDKWLSDNLFEIIMNKTIDPINSTAKSLYNLFRLDMIIGISFRSNYLFIIDDMFVSELGELELNMLNIFKGNFIKVKLGSIVKSIDKIILKNKI
jgi:hypothetical protein